MPRTARVFLSYRREDSKHVAARIGERLDARFQLFMDVDAIQPGMDFAAVMASAVGQSDVLVAVIGDGWLKAADRYGQRRLEDPSDFVVTEIGTALQRRITIIPVLVDGAQMPSRAELPPVLADLSTRHALSVSHETFAADMARLIAAIDSVTAGRLRERVARAHAQMRALAASGQWAALLAVDAEVAELDPQAADVDGLASRARYELSQAQAHGISGVGGWPGGPQGPWNPPLPPPPEPARKRRLALALIVVGICAVLVIVAAVVINRPNDPVTGETPSATGAVERRRPHPAARGQRATQRTAEPRADRFQWHARWTPTPRCWRTCPRRTTPTAARSPSTSFEQLTKGLTIALRCDLLSGQPDGVEYWQYKSADAMQKAFDGFFERGPKGSCMTAAGTDRWTVTGNPETRGVLHCYPADNGSDQLRVDQRGPGDHGLDLLDQPHLPRHLRLLDHRRALLSFDRHRIRGRRWNLSAGPEAQTQQAERESDRQHDTAQRGDLLEDHRNWQGQGQ